MVDSGDARPRDDRRRALIGFLADRDEPYPACGYSLRGLQDEACPECGEALWLRVGIVEPRLGLFISGLLGLAAGAGFFGVMFVFGMYALIDGRIAVNESFWFAYFGLAFVVSTGGIVAWVRCRVRVRRLPRAVGLGLVLGGWILTLGMVIVFFSFAAV